MHGPSSVYNFCNFRTVAVCMIKTTEMVGDELRQPSSATVRNECTGVCRGHADTAPAAARSGTNAPAFNNSHVPQDTVIAKILILCLLFTVEADGATRAVSYC